MEHRRTRYGYVVRLDAGEEIVGALRDLAARENVRAGLISGIGAAADVELGYFVRGTREYVRRTFEGEWEILALTGNLSDLEGEAFPHCHVTLGGKDFAAHGGHLFRGTVTVTCEIQLVTDPDAIRRLRRPDLGFNPLAPRG
jgi:predicted DNA-binding protein with PD1-like motif